MLSTRTLLVVGAAAFLQSPCDAFRAGDMTPSGENKSTKASIVAPTQILTDAVEAATSVRPQFLIHDDDSFLPSKPCTLVPLSTHLNLDVPPRRHAVRRKKWGIDNDDTSEYWFNNKIHTFGNTGFWGGFHAIVAPVATKIIDTVAYDGKSAREVIADKLRASMSNNKNPRILDLCCGVGISTRALQKSFEGNAEMLIGVDTSPEMVAMARALNRHREEIEFVKLAMNKTILPIRSLMKTAEVEVRSAVKRTENVINTSTSYVMGNAQRTIFPRQSFDLVTIMYAFHEAPKYGRYLMLREARRLLTRGGKLVVVDICPTYTPSPTMLAGEPFVLEYKMNIQDQMKSLAGFADFDFESVVKGHVVMWTLTRK